MDIATAYDVLFWFHGSHQNAAKALGYSRSYYAALRSGRSSLNRRTRFSIIMSAELIAVEHPEVDQWLKVRSPELLARAVLQSKPLSNLLLHPPKDQPLQNTPQDMSSPAAGSDNLASL